MYNVSSCSWIFARKWPQVVQGTPLSLICSFFSFLSWIIVVSPVLMLVIWGSFLIGILERDVIGLAIIMAGSAFLLSFYSIMLWWRTQWQSSSMCIFFLLLVLSFFNFFFGHIAINNDMTTHTEVCFII